VQPSTSNEFVSFSVNKNDWLGAVLSWQRQHTQSGLSDNQGARGYLLDCAGEIIFFISIEGAARPKGRGETRL